MKKQTIGKTLILSFTITSVLGLTLNSAFAEQRSNTFPDPVIGGTCPFNPYDLPPGHRCSLEPKPWWKHRDEIVPLNQQQKSTKVIESNQKQEKQFLQGESR